MKKYLTGIILASMLVMVPFVSGAATTAEVISSLQAQIQTLLAQIAALQSGTATSSIVVAKKSATLAQVYEGGEQKVKATFNLLIDNNGNSTIYLPQSFRPISGRLVNKTRSLEPWVNSCSVVSYTTNNVPVVWDSGKINSYLSLLPGKTIDYTYILTCKTEELLSGEYGARITDINWAKDLANTSGLEGLSLVNMATSNTLNIVGEKGPWISDVKMIYDVNGNNKGGYINGERLNNTIVYVGGIKSSKDVVANDNRGMQLAFSLPSQLVIPGSYPVYVISSSGMKSNTVSVMIETPPIPFVCPKDLYVCPNGQSVSRSGTNCAFVCPATSEIDPKISTVAGNFYPGGWVKLSGARLTTDVKITGAGSSGTTVVTPLSIKDTNGDGTRIDFQLPSTMVPGAYYVNVYGKTQLKSNTMPLSVSAKTSANTQLNQMANILEAMSTLLEKFKN